MSGLDLATSMYEESTRSDSLLRDKHWMMCWEAIQAAIRKRHSFLLYEVPAHVYGPYPPQDTSEIVTYLLTECREQNFKVNLVDPAGNVIRISGWAEKARSKQQQDAEFTRSYAVIPHDVQVAQDVDEVMRIPKPSTKPAVGSLSAHLAEVKKRYGKQQ
jgi:hypothetical protein